MTKYGILASQWNGILSKISLIITFKAKVQVEEQDDTNVVLGNVEIIWRFPVESQGTQVPKMVTEL